MDAGNSLAATSVRSRKCRHDEESGPERDNTLNRAFVASRCVFLPAHRRSDAAAEFKSEADQRGRPSRPPNNRMNLTALRAAGYPWRWAPKP